MARYTIQFTNGFMRLDPVIYILNDKNNPVRKCTQKTSAGYEIGLNPGESVLACLDGYKAKWIPQKFLKPGFTINKFLMVRGDQYDRSYLAGKYCDNIKNHNGSDPDTDETPSTLPDNFDSDFEIGNIKPPYHTQHPPADPILRTMKFKIIDAQTNEPLMGAEVYNHTRKKGTVSDINGYVTIEAAPQDKMEIRYLGYKPVIIMAQNIGDTVVMEQTAETLDTVIIETTREKKNKWWWWVIAGVGALLTLSGNDSGMGEPEVPEIETD